MALPTNGPISHSLIMGEFSQPSGSWSLSADGGPLIDYPSGAPKVKESDFYGKSAAVDPAPSDAPQLIAQGGWRNQYTSGNPLNPGTEDGNRRVDLSYPGNYKAGDVILINHAFKTKSYSTNHTLTLKDSSKWATTPSLMSGSGSGSSPDFFGYSNGFTFVALQDNTSFDANFRQDGGAFAHQDAWFHVRPPTAGITVGSSVQHSYEAFSYAPTPSSQTGTGLLISFSYAPYQNNSSNTAWNKPGFVSFTSKSLVNGYNNDDNWTVGGYGQIETWVSPNGGIPDFDQIWFGAVWNNRPAARDELYTGLAYIPALAIPSTEITTRPSYATNGGMCPCTGFKMNTFPYVP